MSGGFLQSQSYIIICYDMIIKHKGSENLLGKSETVVVFNKQTVLLEYISFLMNVLLKCFNIDIRKFQCHDIINYIDVID